MRSGVHNGVYGGRHGDGGRGQRQEGVEETRGRAHAGRDAPALAARPAALPPAARQAPHRARQEEAQEPHQGTGSHPPAAPGPGRVHVLHYNYYYILD